MIGKSTLDNIGKSVIHGRGKQEGPCHADSFSSWKKSCSIAVLHDSVTLSHSHMIEKGQLYDIIHTPFLSTTKTGKGYFHEQNEQKGNLREA